MKKQTKDTLKEASIIVASAAGSYLAKKSIDKLFTKTTGDTPPKTIKRSGFSAPKVIGYTLLTSFAAGMLSLFMRDRVVREIEED